MWTSIVDKLCMCSCVCVCVFGRRTGFGQTYIAVLECQRNNRIVVIHRNDDYVIECADTRTLVSLKSALLKSQYRGIYNEYCLLTKNVRCISNAKTFFQLLFHDFFSSIGTILIVHPKRCQNFLPAANHWPHLLIGLTTEPRPQYHLTEHLYVYRVSGLWSSH